MIGSLRGTLLDRSGSELLIEVGGVGYRVSMAGSDSGGFEVGEEAFVHVHHHIREDAQSLFGFLTIDERQVFELLFVGVGRWHSFGAPCGRYRWRDVSDFRRAGRPRGAWVFA